MTVTRDELLAYRESLRMHLQRTADGEAWDAAGGIPRDVLRAAAEHGFLATAVPEELGGMGLDDVRFDAVAIEEAMRAGLPSLALVLQGHGDVPVRALAAADVRADWLVGLATAELRAATALHAGGGVRAQADGTLDGTAQAVVGAAQADLVVLAAEGSHGRVLAAIETSAPGIAVEPIEEPVGLRAAGLAHLTLAQAPGVLLPDAELEDLLIGERLLLSLGALAAARAAMQITTDYVRERRAFGTPIATFQNTRQLLGAAAAQLRGAEAFANECLQARVEDRLSATDAAALKLLATEIQAAVADAGVQLHGGYGYMLEYPISHAYADARFLHLHGTSSQVLRDELGSALLDSHPLGTTS